MAKKFSFDVEAACAEVERELNRIEERMGELLREIKRPLYIYRNEAVRRWIKEAEDSTVPMLKAVANEVGFTARADFYKVESPEELRRAWDTIKRWAKFKEAMEPKE